MTRIAIVEDEEKYYNILKQYIEQFEKDSTEEIEAVWFQNGAHITFSPINRQLKTILFFLPVAIIYWQFYSVQQLSLYQTFKSFIQLIQPFFCYTYLSSIL